MFLVILNSAFHAPSPIRALLFRVNFPSRFDMRYFYVVIFNYKNEHRFGFVLSSVSGYLHTKHHVNDYIYIVRLPTRTVMSLSMSLSIYIFNRLM